MTTLSQLIKFPNDLFCNFDGLRDNLADPIVVLSKWGKNKFFSFPSRGSDVVKDMESVSDVITAFGFFRDLRKLNNNSVEGLQYVKILNSGCKWLNYLASRKIFQWNGAIKGTVEKAESISGIFVASVKAYKTVNSELKSTKVMVAGLQIIRDVSFLAFEMLKSPWFKRDSDMLKLCALTTGVFAGLSHEVIVHFNTAR